MSSMDYEKIVTEDKLKEIDFIIEVQNRNF